MSEASSQQSWPRPNWANDELARGLAHVNHQLGKIHTYYASRAGNRSVWQDMLTSNPIKKLGSSKLRSVELAHRKLRKDAARVIPILINDWDCYIGLVGTVRGPRACDEIYKLAEKGAGPLYLHILTVILPQSVQRAAGGDLSAEYAAIGADNHLLYPRVHDFSEIESSVRYAGLSMKAWVELEVHKTEASE